MRHGADVRRQLGGCGWLARMAGAVGLLVLCSVPPAQAESGSSRPATSPLDLLQRMAPAVGPVRCPEVELVDYRGTTIRYQHRAKVHPSFVERLRRFELVVAEVSREVYGRAPRRIVHMGSYSCRRMAKYRRWLSEHALGNAIDIEGFDFGPAPRGTPLPDDLPKVFRGYFRVRVQPHWGAKHGLVAVHSRFLRLLIDRLIARRDIFGVLIGPGYVGHHNHFHFDGAPWRSVRGFRGLWPQPQPKVPRDAAASPRSAAPKPRRSPARAGVRGGAGSGDACVWCTRPKGAKARE